MISLLEDYLADVDNKSAVSCVRSILKYPLDKSELDFCLTEEDEKLLYDKYFYRIILHVFEKVKQSPNSEILHLAGYITQYSKADVWLECMCALVGQLDASGKDLVVKELERFFSELDRVSDFINACLHNVDVHSECAPAFMESRVRLLCNIPALVSNLKHGGCSYFTDDSSFVIKVLSAFERVAEISERSCQFIGLAVSCLCMTGYTEHVSDFIIKQSIGNTIHLWSKFLKYVNAKALEITLSPLAKKCPTSSMYYALISELLETSTGFDAYMRLCRRLFYIRQFRTGNTIRNIFSSFCLAVKKRESQEKSIQLIEQVDENLGLPALSVWSDVSSIQSASLERRIYISQIFISWFVDFRNVLSSQFTIRDDDLLPDVLSGISNHLASPRIEIRTLGMVIGEWIVTLLKWDTGSEDQKLKFDYVELEFLKQIRPYFVSLDENHGVESNLQATIPTETISGSDSHEDTVASRDHESNGEDSTVNQTVHELDSDDDPDSDNDSLKPLPSTQCSSYSDKTPHYLRECLDGMLLTKVEDSKNFRSQQWKSIHHFCKYLIISIILIHLKYLIIKKIIHSSSPTYHHPDLAAPNSSLRPVHAEVCVSPYNCEEFSIIESCVVEFLRHLGPRHVPTVLESPYSDLNFMSLTGNMMKVREILTNCVLSINLVLDEADGLHENDAGRSINLSVAVIVIHVYQLVSGEEALPVQEIIESGSESINGGTTWLLPSLEMCGLWESLVFDSDVKLNLLQYAQTALLFADREVSSSVISWNRVIFLYGPPGTGKTSLCRALANKLAIRMSNNYSSAQLIEINAMNLMSKWFSESAHLVSKMFDSIKEYLQSPKHLVVLVVDEVESLTATRSASSAGCEPSDAIRVVNSVLTQIDQVKRFPNILILATSNITSLIDPAFLDRADLRIFIDTPSSPAIYSIYRSCLLELMRVGLISSTEDSCLLSYRTLSSVQFSEEHANSLSISLWRLSERSSGLNGRTLRKLPLLAYAFHLNKVMPDMQYNSSLHNRRQVHLPQNSRQESSILNNSLSCSNVSTSSMIMNNGANNSATLSPPLLSTSSASDSVQSNNVTLQCFIRALQLAVDAQFSENQSLDSASFGRGGRLNGNQ
uniref:AAA+ ATPase domain-containing protein n=1 Tax=Trichobilharzia regenti TaxID=157069 RepID=A0AA85K8W7_TRIRE|nr:unnamed protein product [Trichobilharzia regenti]